MHLTLLRSYSNKASWSRVLSISLDPAICSIASAKLGFFQRFLVAPKSHLKCLDYQPLKDMEMERQELRKTTMDCVENCGYNNLSLSRFVSMVFSLKALFNIYGYIQCGQGHGVSNMTNWQNRIFRGYLAGRPYPRDTHENQLSPSCPNSSHSSHVLGICITSRESFS